MIDFAHARKVMVDNQLRTSNITDRRLLGAMGRVPRERFVPAARQALAYIDEAHPLQGRGGRALPAPAPFAKLVHLARIAPTDRILDVGCGSGYSTAVLAELGAAVVGIEDQPELVELARENLVAVGAPNASVVRADLAAGPAEEGEFDVIVVEGMLETAPRGLLARLADGGRLVALIRKGATASAHLFVRSGSDVASRTDFNASLPPLTPPASEQFVF